MSVIGTITPEPAEPRLRAACITEGIRSAFHSAKDLHARLGPAIQKRGYFRGLYGRSNRCPIRSGALRPHWLIGYDRGRADRTAALQEP